MNLEINTHSKFRNTYILGLATASALITLGLSSPVALADDNTESVQPVLRPTDTPQTETVQVKRVIYFHLLSRLNKIEQVSHAHRQISIDPVTHQQIISPWKVDPFPRVKIPPQFGFKPSPNTIPIITETDDLSCFNRPIDIFYHPLEESDLLAEDAAVELSNKETQTETTTKKMADSSTNTEAHPLINSAVQNDLVILTDTATNTDQLVTADEAIQKGSAGVDVTTETEDAKQKDQATQSIINSTDIGVGDSEVITIDTKSGNDEQLRYEEKDIQTDNPPFSETAVGDDSIDYVSEASQTSFPPLYQEQKDKTSQTNNNPLIEKGIGDSSIEDISTGTQVSISETDSATNTAPLLTINRGCGETTIEEPHNSLVIATHEVQTDLPLANKETQTKEAESSDSSIQTSHLGIDKASQAVSTTNDVATNTLTAEHQDESTQYEELITDNQQTSFDEDKIATNFSTDNQFDWGHTKNLSTGEKVKPMSSIQRANLSESDELDYSPRSFHRRIKSINNKIRKRRNHHDAKQEGMLPQTGNNANSKSTIIGLGIIFFVAKISLSALKRILMAHNLK